MITGAQGFVGGALCTSLRKQEWSVRPVARARSSNNGDHIEVGNIDPDTNWNLALSDTQYIVHCAAHVHRVQGHTQDSLREFRRVNTLSTESLARAAARSGVKRFIFLSSIKVNGESAPPDVPFNQTSPAKPHDSYAISKLEAEQALARVSSETGLEVVILRCPLVYGPRVKANFLRLLKAVKRGIPLPFSLVENRRSLIYLDNLTDAIATCLTHPSAAGKTYLVSDGEDVSTAELISLIAQALGKPSRLWPCPLGMIQLAGILIGKSDEIERLLGSLCIDSSKIRSELDWMPPYTLVQGLAETARWFHGQCNHD